MIGGVEYPLARGGLLVLLVEIGRREKDAGPLTSFWCSPTLPPLIDRTGWRLTGRGRPEADAAGELPVEKEYLWADRGGAVIVRLFCLLLSREVKSEG